MDAEIEDDEPFCLGEIGLAGHHVVAGPPAEVGEERLADGARGDGLLHRDQRRLEAKILVHHDRLAGGLGAGQNAPDGSEIGGEGLLADRGELVLGCQRHQCLVALHRRRDVDEVEPLGSQHGAGVGVGLGAGQGSRRLGLGGIEVADGDEPGAGDVVPGVEMVTGKEAAADDGAPEIAHRPAPPTASARPVSALS